MKPQLSPSPKTLQTLFHFSNNYLLFVSMASITVEKQKESADGSGSSGGGFLGSFLPDSSSPTKNDSAGAYVPVIMEDLVGLSVMREEEREKMILVRKGVSIKEDDEVLTVRSEMPGLVKENVKVVVLNNTLIISGKEHEKETDDENENENTKINYHFHMNLRENMFKYEEMKAVMKDGVLIVVVPKKNEEERKPRMNATLLAYTISVCLLAPFLFPYELLATHLSLSLSVCGFEIC